MRLGRTAETVSIEGLIQENTGMITCEGASCCIGPMHAGRQSYDKQPGGSISKRGDGPGMVSWIVSLHLVEKTGQP